MWKRHLLLVVALVSLLVPGEAEAKREQRERRESLKEQLGIPRAAPKGDDRGTPPPPSSGKDDEQNERSEQHDQDDPNEQSEGAAPPSAQRSLATKRARPVFFEPHLHPVLVGKCQQCHRAGRRAARSGFVITGDVDTDYDATLAFVAKRAPLTSSLLLRPRGDDHSKVWADGSAEDVLLAAFLAGGALRRAAGASLSPPEATPTPVVTSPPGSEAPTTTTTTSAPPTATTTATMTPASALVPAPAPAAAPARAQPVPATAGPAFDEVHHLLRAQCAECHAPGGMGAGSGYVVVDDATAHHASASQRVTPGQPAKSALFLAATGRGHMPVLDEGSAEARALAAWIAAGAPGPRPPSASPVVGDDAQAPAAPMSTGPIADHTTAAASPYATSGGGPSSSTTPLLSPQPLLDAMGQAVPLLQGFALHGRFDLSYERRGYTNNPWSEGATDALRSYHHFLFLSRHSPRDPFGLDVELTSLQFWEVSLAHRFGPVTTSGKVGKILVPFGADPLYHASYGGLAGFDQRMLPIVWAQEGARGTAHLAFFGVGVAADVYAVRGHRLRDEESTLNLQTDLSPIDDVKIAGGARLRFSWGPLSAWYSAYLNPLGFDRLLFLQALDVGFFRWRSVPFLRDVALSAGVLRGDVSGGGGGMGPGQDHYHFGTYVQARYYVLDGLYFQYRQGVRTFDNRGGLLFDDRRFTSADASTHSVAMVAEWRGLQVGAYHFWNLEKVDEIDDDFLRLTVAYAF